MVTIEIKDAKNNINTIIAVDGQIIHYIRKIVLDAIDGSYVEIYDLNEKSEKEAEILTKEGFMINLIKPDGID